MLSRGSAFRCLQPPGHVFIVLTPPDENGEALIVNLSTLRDGEEDCSCVLKPHDYPVFIKHNTVVMYRRAMVGGVAQLQNTRHFERMEDMPPATMAKITEGALKSDHLRERYKELVRKSIKPE